MIVKMIHRWMIIDVYRICVWYMLSALHTEPRSWCPWSWFSIYLICWYRVSHWAQNYLLADQLTLEIYLSLSHSIRVTCPWSRIRSPSLWSRHFTDWATSSAPQLVNKHQWMQKGSQNPLKQNSYLKLSCQALESAVRHKRNRVHRLRIFLTVWQDSVLKSEAGRSQVPRSCDQSWHGKKEDLHKYINADWGFFWMPRFQGIPDQSWGCISWKRYPRVSTQKALGGS